MDQSIRVQDQSIVTGEKISFPSFKDKLIDSLIELSKTNRFIHFLQKFIFETLPNPNSTIPIYTKTYTIMNPC